MQRGEREGRGGAGRGGGRLGGGPKGREGGRGSEKMNHIPAICRKSRNG